MKYDTTFYLSSMGMSNHNENFAILSSKVKGWKDTVQPGSGEVAV